VVRKLAAWSVSRVRSGYWAPSGTGAGPRLTLLAEPPCQFYKLCLGARQAVYAVSLCGKPFALRRGPCLQPKAIVGRSAPAHRRDGAWSVVTTLAGLPLIMRAARGLPDSDP
jgi:hypothetical protein